MQTLAPIVLFVFNRPWHTQQTLDALANNHLAVDSELFVFCDGPKQGMNEAELNQIQETRTIVLNEKRFKKVHVSLSDANNGLADSIIQGVTEIVNQFGKIIVLEDDILTSPAFLTYMNNALNMYEKDIKVMHISGYMFPINLINTFTFFMRPTTCWGWATWKRAWDHFEKDVDKQINQIEQMDGWKEFTLNNSYPSYKDQLFLNKKGKLNTWAIFWQTSVYLKRGFSLHPSISYTRNIGLDGSGTNCNESKIYDLNELNLNPNISKIKIDISKKYISKVEFYFNSFTKSRDISFRDKFYLLRKKIFKK